MGQRIKRLGRATGLHVRRQAVGYLALAVALGGSAYAGTKAGSGKVGARDLKPFTVRLAPNVTVPPGQQGTSTANCKRGQAALEWMPGGGTNAAFITGAIERLNDTGRPTGYEVIARNDTAQAQELSAAVLCLRR